MGFKHWALSKKMWMLCGLLIANSLILGGLAFYDTGYLLERLNLVAKKEVPAVRAASLVDMYHDGLRANVMTAVYKMERGESLVEMRAEFEEMKTELRTNLQLVKGVNLTAEILEAIRLMEPVLESYVTIAGDMIAAAERSDRQILQDKMPVFLTAFTEVEQKLQVFGNLIMGTAEAITKETEEAETEITLINFAVMAFGLLLGLVSSWIFVRSLSHTIRNAVTTLEQGAGKLTQSSGQIHRASMDLANAATQQAAAIEETVSSMEEMTSMLSQTTQNAQEGLVVADAAQQDLVKGREVIVRMTAAMDEIQTSNEKLEGLVALIDQIQTKTKVINDIVFETRLLSFNASIEAARAGVHGKGFAVVAEEVGKLATMSGKAAEEIRGLLESSTKEVAQVVRDTKERVNSGKATSQECADAFQRMGNTLEQITESVKTIAAAAKEQEAGVRQTNVAMNEMDQATQKNAAASETLALESSTLASASGDVSGIVGTMRKLVNGSEGYTSGISLNGSADSDTSSKREKSESFQDRTGKQRPFRIKDRQEMHETSMGGDEFSKEPSVGLAEKGVSREDPRWNKAS